MARRASAESCGVLKVSCSPMIGRACAIFCYAACGGGRSGALAFHCAPPACAPRSVPLSQQHQQTRRTISSRVPCFAQTPALPTRRCQEPRKWMARDTTTTTAEARTVPGVATAGRGGSQSLLVRRALEGSDGSEEVYQGLYVDA